MQRRDYQTAAAEYVVGRLLAGRNALVVSPTGSGKSLILIDVLTDPRLEGGVHLLVPTLEIALGVYSKRDNAIALSGVSEEKQRVVLAHSGIWTVKHYHNLILGGKIIPPKYLLFDEAHHSTDDTHTIIAAACGNPPMAGLTATAYRGTPEETAKLVRVWGEPWSALSLRDAVKNGYVSRPDFEVWPLVNDDQITIRDGEFVLSQIEGAIEETLPTLVDRVAAELYTPLDRWLRPTVFRAPGVKSAEMIGDALNQAGMSAWVITGETPARMRENAFQNAVSRSAAIVQVRVVGEGVDLPLRVMVDLAPTVSPLLWMQSVGRITRPVGAVCSACGNRLPRPLMMPGFLPPERQVCPSAVCNAVGTLRAEPPPLYIATNHNLTRHAYLWQGLIPAGQIRQAQQAWGEAFKPKRRHLARALGLEGFGKFMVTPVPMADGTTGSLYAIQTKDGLHQYAVLLHAAIGEPMYFEKKNEHTGEILVHTTETGRQVEYMKKKYGPWRRIDSIPSAEGYQTIKPRPVTDPMLSWWNRERGGATSRGLDGSVTPDSRQFEALPMLADTGSRFVTQED